MVESKDENPSGVAKELYTSPTQITSVFGMMRHGERIDKTVSERFKLD